MEPAALSTKLRIIVHDFTHQLLDQLLADPKKGGGASS